MSLNDDGTEKQENVMSGSGTGQKILPAFNARLFLLYLAFTLIIPAITVKISDGQLSWK